MLAPMTSKAWALASPSAPAKTSLVDTSSTLLRRGGMDFVDVIGVGEGTVAIDLSSAARTNYLLVDGAKVNARCRQ